MLISRVQQIQALRLPAASPVHSSALDSPHSLSTPPSTSNISFQRRPSLPLRPHLFRACVSHLLCPCPDQLCPTVRRCLQPPPPPSTSPVSSTPPLPTTLLPSLSHPPSPPAVITRRHLFSGVDVYGCDRGPVKTRDMDGTSIPCGFVNRLYTLRTIHLRSNTLSSLRVSDWCGSRESPLFCAYSEQSSRVNRWDSRRPEDTVTYANSSLLLQF